MFEFPMRRPCSGGACRCSDGAPQLSSSLRPAKPVRLDSHTVEEYPKDQRRYTGPVPKVGAPPRSKVQVNSGGASLSSVGPQIFLRSIEVRKAGNFADAGKPKGGRRYGEANHSLRAQNKRPFKECGWPVLSIVDTPTLFREQRAPRTPPEPLSL